MALFGATGRTGGLLLAGALARGHTVRALARQPDRLAGVLGISVVEGDVLDPIAVAATVSGADAVVMALGSAGLGAPGEAIGRGTTHVADACVRYGVSRVVALAGGGILDAPEGGLRRDRVGYPAVFLPVSAQHHQAWQALRTLGLDYTMVCTPDLTDTPPTGRYRLVERLMPEGGKRISRGDVAAVMLEAVEQQRWVRERVGLAD